MDTCGIGMDGGGMDRWMDGCRYGWTDGWMEGWMGVDGQVDSVNELWSRGW